MVYFFVVIFYYYLIPHSHTVQIVATMNGNNDEERKSSKRRRTSAEIVKAGHRNLLSCMGPSEERNDGFAPFYFYIASLVSLTDETETEVMGPAKAQCFFMPKYSDIIDSLPAICAVHPHPPTQAQGEFFHLYKYLSQNLIVRKVMNLPLLFYFL